MHVAEFDSLFFFFSFDISYYQTAEGVGKSSLISTFVSRHFSEVVPGIMTRVRLPPDPENSCITTIVDSQGGDAALISAVANMATTGAAAAALPTSPTTASITDGGNTSESIDRGGLDSLTVASSPSMSLSMATTPGSNFLRGNSYGNLANIGNSSVNEQVPSTRSFTRPGGMGGIENVDSIILIYDLDRDETFFRLENHWLPLIERCFNGEVSFSPMVVLTINHHQFSKCYSSLTL